MRKSGRKSTLPEAQSPTPLQDPSRLFCFSWPRRLPTASWLFSSSHVYLLACSRLLGPRLHPDPQGARSGTPPPSFSSAATTRPNVSVLAVTAPFDSSILRTVPSSAFDLRARSVCANPNSARAARICLPVMTITREP